MSSATNLNEYKAEVEEGMKSGVRMYILLCWGYGGPGVQYVWFIARSKALFIALFTA